MVHFHVTVFIILTILTNNLCQPLTIQEDGNATIKYKVKDSCYTHKHRRSCLKEGYPQYQPRISNDVPETPLSKLIPNFK